MNLAWGKERMRHYYHFLLFVLLCGVSPAAEIPVSPTGSDDHPGTREAPVQTLEKARVPGASPATLDENFRDVPVADRPWCYWWWINGHVDKETITSDLEAMRRVGFGGLLMFDARGYWDDKGHVVLPQAQDGVHEPPVARTAGVRDPGGRPRGLAGQRQPQQLRGR